MSRSEQPYFPKHRKAERKSERKPCAQGSVLVLERRESARLGISGARLRSALWLPIFIQTLPHNHVFYLIVL